MIEINECININQVRKVRKPVNLKREKSKQWVRMTNEVRVINQNGAGKRGGFPCVKNGKGNRFNHFKSEPNPIRNG